MPTRDGHLPSRRRGSILLWGGPWDVSPGLMAVWKYIVFTHFNHFIRLSPV
jgi:hypothetical protein